MQSIDSSLNMRHRPSPKAPREMVMIHCIDSRACTSARCIEQPCRRRCQLLTTAYALTHADSLQADRACMITLALLMVSMSSSATATSAPCTHAQSQV